MLKALQQTQPEEGAKSQSAARPLNQRAARAGRIINLIGLWMNWISYPIARVWR